jgi:sterol desaturase/sphingolipid hydroxylase (fatty acid hydroxylase superfamily)
MEESHSSSNDIYASNQKKIGDLFYIFIVISCIICIAGGIWSILDFIMPTGKLDAFLGLTLGYQIAIIAAFLAGLFFLLIFFFGLFKKGRRWVLHFIFKVKEIEEKYKNRTDVKIAAGGLLISIMAIIIGVVISIIQEMLLGEQSSLFSVLLTSFSAGNWILFAGISLFAILAVTLFMIYFWKNGYYVILRVMGKLEK